MTSWSWKKKSTGNSECESCLCLSVFQGFLEFIEKRKNQKSLMLTETTSKSKYWEVTPQGKNVCKLHYFLDIQSFWLTKAPQLSRVTLGFWGETQCPSYFSSIWESWVFCFGGRKGLHCGTLQKSQMFLNIRCFRNMQGLIPCSHLEFTDSWWMHGRSCQLTAFQGQKQSAVEQYGKWEHTGRHWDSAQAGALKPIPVTGLLII